MCGNRLLSTKLVPWLKCQRAFYEGEMAWMQRDPQSDAASLPRPMLFCKANLRRVCLPFSGTSAVEHSSFTESSRAGHHSLHINSPVATHLREAKPKGSNWVLGHPQRHSMNEGTDSRGAWLSQKLPMLKTRFLPYF